LKGQRHWEAFHGRWAAALADSLNEDLLPKNYFAEFQVQLGVQVEVDVATLEETPSSPVDRPRGAVATVEPRLWTPPAPCAVIPALIPDDIEVQVFATEAGPTLVAAVELVSPANKDRPESRRAFAAKCAAYLQRGIGLVVVDVVTSRQANLHEGLVRLLGQDQTLEPLSSPLYTTAYHPTRREDADWIEMWLENLTVGFPLPTMPLAVRGLGFLPLDLEATYTEARQHCRLGEIGKLE
jgi:hypothetical protein